MGVLVGRRPFFGTHICKTHTTALCTIAPRNSPPSLSPPPLAAVWCAVTVPIGDVCTYMRVEPMGSPWKNKNKKKQEKENAAASVSRDRWSDQGKHNHGRGGGGGGGRKHTAGGVCLDADRNVDYLATLSSGNHSTASRGRRSPPAGGAGIGGSMRGLFQLSGERGGGGRLSGGSGKLAAARGSFPLNVIRGADAVSEPLMMQRKRKRQQEIDDREREQVCGRWHVFVWVGGWVGGRVRCVCRILATAVRHACYNCGFIIACWCSINASGGGGERQQTGKIGSGSSTQQPAPSTQ